MGAMSDIAMLEAEYERDIRALERACEGGDELAIEHWEDVVNCSRRALLEARGEADPLNIDRELGDYLAGEH
jgi:hypothetical protein